MKKSGRGIGIFYIIATLSGIASAIIHSIRIGKPTNIWMENFLIVNEGLAILLMAIAIVMITILFFRKLVQYNEAFSYGYMLLRVMESILFLGMATLVIVEAKALNGKNEVLNQDSLTILTQSMNELSMLVFGLSAFILAYMLIRYKLLPKYISFWGMGASLLYIAASILGLYDVHITFDAFEVVMLSPMALNEMVMAIYLIIKGFKK